MASAGVLSPKTLELSQEVLVSLKISSSQHPPKQEEMAVCLEPPPAQ